MKYFYFFVLFVFLSPIQANAFNFHGVKSGMTKEQVSQAMKGIGAEINKYDETKWEKFDSIGRPPAAAILEYDHAEKLLQIQLVYTTYALSISAIEALKSVLKNNFKATILEFDGGMGAVLLDEKMYGEDIEHFKRKYLQEL